MVHHEHGLVTVLEIEYIGIVGVFSAHSSCVTTFLPTNIFQVTILATISILDCAVCRIPVLLKFPLLPKGKGMLLVPLFAQACLVRFVKLGTHLLLPRFPRPRTRLESLYLEHLSF